MLNTVDRGSKNVSDLISSLGVDETQVDGSSETRILIQNPDKLLQVPQFTSHATSSRTQTIQAFVLSLSWLET